MATESNELKEIKDILTDLRICVAKMEANQSSFKGTLDVFREERLKTYDIMTKKIDDIEKDVISLDKKINYAAGAVTALTAFISFIVSTVSKKLGLA